MHVPGARYAVESFMFSPLFPVAKSQRYFPVFPVYQWWRSRLNCPENICIAIFWKLSRLHWRFWQPIFSKAFHGVEPHRGEVFLFSRSHGAVRCVFHYIFGESYGAVRRGFHFFKIIRCAVRIFFLNVAVRCGLCSSRIVRCDVVRLSVEQLFPTVRLSVHRSRETGVP